MGAHLPGGNHSEAYVRAEQLGRWASKRPLAAAAIRHCTMIPGHVIDKKFSVLVVSDDDESEIIGIPARIDLKKLGGLLTSKDVPVSVGRSVPEPFRRSMSLRVVGVVGAVGCTFSVRGVGLLCCQGFRAPGPRRGHDRRSATGTTGGLCGCQATVRGSPSAFRDGTVDIGEGQPLRSRSGGPAASESPYAEHFPSAAGAQVPAAPPPPSPLMPNTSPAPVRSGPGGPAAASESPLQALPSTGRSSPASGHCPQVSSCWTIRRCLRALKSQRFRQRRPRNLPMRITPPPWTCSGACDQRMPLPGMHPSDQQGSLSRLDRATGIRR